MRPYLKLILLLLMAQAANGRDTGNDTLFYSKDWQACDRAAAAYFRPAPVFANGRYTVKDFFISGRLQMEGYLLRISPELKDSTFSYYDEKGRIELQEQYRHNRLVGIRRSFYDQRIVKEEQFLPDSGSLLLSIYDSSNGVLRSRGIMREGREDGAWKRFSKTGKHTHTLHQQNGKFEGLTTEYDTVSGNVVKEGLFVNDHLVEIKTYSSSGKLFKMFPVANGLIHGIMKIYDTLTGNLYMSKTMKDDVPEGPANYYSPNCGLLVKSANLKAGKPEGECRYYYECTDKLYSIFNYKNGKRDGHYIAYSHSTGKRIAEGFNLADEEEGAWTFYFPEDGTTRRCVKNFREGQYHGELSSWWPNGQLRRKQHYQMGKLISSKCFTESGKDTGNYPFHTPARFLKDPWYYFSTQMVYPELALQKHLSGEVVLKITIEADARISNVWVASSTDPIFNEEAVRIAHLLPVVSPALEDGTPFYSEITIPVVFRAPR
jgi:TonB family protein